MTTDQAEARRWAWPVIALGVLALTSGAGVTGPLDVRALARAGTQTALGLAALALGVAGLSGRPLRDTLRARPSLPPVSAGELIAMCAGLLALSALLDTALEQLGWRDASRLAAIERILAGADGTELALALLGLAIAPALAEELLFRGVVLGGLLGRMPGWLAVAISAAVFGAAHLDLAQGLATAVLGLYLAVVSLATRSIRTGVVAHLANNAAAVVVPAATAGLPDRPWVSGAVGLGLAAGLFSASWVIGRRLARGEPGPA